MSGLESTADGTAAQPEPAPVADAAPSSSLAELEGIAELDVEQHPDVYQRIHAELQGALASIDDA